MQIYIIIVVVNIFIGLLGRKKRFGFWGYFFASCLLTPIIGLLLVIASGPQKKPV